MISYDPMFGQSFGSMWDSFCELSCKLLGEDVATYQERLASYWAKMLKRIRNVLGIASLVRPAISHPASQPAGRPAGWPKTKHQLAGRPATNQAPAGRPAGHKVSPSWPAGRPKTKPQLAGRPAKNQAQAGRPATNQAPAGRPAGRHKPRTS